MTTIEAMKMALEVLEYEYRHCNRYYPELCRAIEALEHVIPQEEQQPVPVKTYSGGKAWPVQTEWVGLTDEDTEQGWKESWVDKQAFESAVWWAEKKLKEKNT
jgi:hypothetical protein